MIGNYGFWIEHSIAADGGYGTIIFRVGLPFSLLQILNTVMTSICKFFSSGNYFSHKTKIIFNTE